MSVVVYATFVQVNALIQAKVSTLDFRVIPLAFEQLEMLNRFRQNRLEIGLKLPYNYTKSRQKWTKQTNQTK